ncbi:hypothetical protein FHETE_8271 [Fusarium heterosporum]|uniref:BTB domain-containing protein n=1 Tax=Fusarium heterosporum TaxID=42747 RepID=A0A8H5T3Y7_FUSHE|nr:hypothetical protein FHETE_8271 [Fusarium heterosporum]
MAHNKSSSDPVLIQRSLQNKTASKKTSNYILDPNGDTQLILSTYKDQPFIWKAETIWIGQERSTTKCLRKNKKKKIKKKAACHSPPVPPPPPPPPESPVSTPISLTQPIVSFSNIPFYTRPDFSDEETTRPDSADSKENADSSSLLAEDCNVGERSGILPNQVEIRMLVSRKHLELASFYFEKMFSGPFTEGKADHSGLRRVTATDWDPEAFNIVLTIIHGYHRDVPGSLGLEMLAKLAIIVDYYECHESTELHVDIWLERLKSEVPTVYGRDCILYMLVSWVFSQPDVFAKMTRLALRHSGKLIEAEDLPIPLDLLEQIDIARQGYLDKIFSAAYDLLDRLQEEPECSYECSSMLLGILTKELKRHGILSPRGAQPFYGFSIGGSVDMINGCKVPRWYDISGSGRYGSGHSCTIQQKLSSALQNAEKELRVFDLQDFQFAKSYMRPPKNVGTFVFECKRSVT